MVRKTAPVKCLGLFLQCFSLAAVVDTPAKSEDSVPSEATALVSLSNGAWGESKLSDVVKGVAKIKPNNGLKPILNGPSSIAKADSQSVPNGDLAQSTIVLTPPTSPGGKKDKQASSTAPPKTSKAQTPQSQLNVLSETAAKISGAPASSASAPCVSYAKMAEQNKDRLEQMAREVKERELEQERERRRVAHTSIPYFLFFGKCNEMSNC